MAVKVQYILTVCDYEVCGLFMKTVRTYRSRSLSNIRHIEGKLARKARKNPLSREVVSRWGSIVHKDNTYNPNRSFTITVKLS